MPVGGGNCVPVGGGNCVPVGSGNCVPVGGGNCVPVGGGNCVPPIYHLYTLMNTHTNHGYIFEWSKLVLED